MVRFLAPNLIVAAAALFQKESLFARAIDTNDCESLGPKNVERFDYSMGLNVDKKCFYKLSFRMKHDPILPVPSDPSHCNRAIVPPAIASDGLPYLVGRPAHDSVRKYIKKATGIDHISIDYQPCGHPPLDVFTVPHYDFHLYLVDTEYRRCRTCKTAVCDPVGQTILNGYSFLNVNTIAVDPDATNAVVVDDDEEALVQLMGGHANQSIKARKNPSVKPVWVLGTHEGRTVFYEPMIPLTFAIEHERSLTHAGQHVDELPDQFAASYDTS